MIVPEFLRFYSGYTLRSTLSEYVTSFFALVNYMYRIQANETLTSINATSVAMADGKEADSAIKSLEKQSKGIQGIVKEVRTVKK